MTIISVTEIGVFKRCRRMWDYSYRQKLTPIQEAPYFFTGRLVHQTLASWTEAPEKDISELWASVMKQEVDFYQERYKQIVGVAPNEMELETVIERGLMPFAMVNNYREYWKQPLPEGFTLIQSEQTCIVNIPGTEHWECDECHRVFPDESELIWRSETAYETAACPYCNGNVTWQATKLEGTLDGFVVDLNGSIFVLERKTYEQRPNIDVLECNEQFVLYSWLMRQLFPDIPLGGVLYDGLWKREKPPAKKELADLFARHLLLKDDEELEEAQQQLTIVAREMTGLPAIYPNRVWQGCWDDTTYQRLCTAETKRDDVEYIKDMYYGKKETVKWFEDEE